MTVFAVRASLVERICEPRGKEVIAFGRFAVARVKVCLAFGETNDTVRITRSVIRLQMREQLPSTTALVICRATDEHFEKAIARTQSQQNHL